MLPPPAESRQGPSFYTDPIGSLFVKLKSGDTAGGCQNVFKILYNEVFLLVV